MSPEKQNSALVNAYQPDTVFPPGDTIQETLDVLGMSQSDLAERTGRSVKNINQIINGKAPVSPEFAIELERVFNVPAHFWANLESNYRAFLAAKQEKSQLASELDWLKGFPLSDLMNDGWITSKNRSVETLTSVLNFFGVANTTAWNDLWSQKQVAFRKSGCFDADFYALAAWLRAGERQAQEVRCESYDAENFRNALQTIRSMTYAPPDDFSQQMVDLCASAGVALVFQPHFKKTHCNGATYWLSKDKALIMLSLRGKREDIFWFTFFHEAGHILLHAKKAVFLENSGPDGKEEQEANHFAAEALIPTKKFHDFLDRTNSLTASTVKKFAKDINIAPGIVVGRLQHDKIIGHGYLNNLKRKIDWRN